MLIKERLAASFMMTGVIFHRDKKALRKAMQYSVGQIKYS
jgi:hypothetical protein